MLQSGSRQSSFRGPLSYCQAVMSETIGNLEMMKSSFINLSVTFLYTVRSHTIHRITQTEPDKQSQIPYNAVKCTPHLKQSHAICQCIPDTVHLLPVSFYVCMCCSTHERSTTHTDFLDMRTAYVSLYVFMFIPCFAYICFIHRMDIPVF